MRQEFNTRQQQPCRVGRPSMLYCMMVHNWSLLLHGGLYDVVPRAFNPRSRRGIEKRQRRHMRENLPLVRDSTHCQRRREKLPRRTKTQTALHLPNHYPAIGCGSFLAMCSIRSQFPEAPKQPDTNGATKQGGSRAVKKKKK